MAEPAIVALGHYYPDGVLDNAYFASRFAVSESWIQERTGIHRRHVADAACATSDLIVPAARVCLEMAGRDPRDVDCILVATVTPDHLFPATAALVQQRLRAAKAWALDLSASSAGFVFALAIARSLIVSRTAASILVCGADKMSAITNYEDPATAILFGDGAGVVLVEEGPGDGLGILDVVLRCDGSGAPSLILPAGGSRNPSTAQTVSDRGHFLIQDGSAVFKSAVAHMCDVCVALMFRNNLTPEDVTWLVPHQANRRIMDAVARHLNVPAERTLSNVEEVGNTWAASIPACLSESHRAGRLRHGDRLLLTSFGAGYAAAGAYIRWGLK
jgi:3-oxoacyl-[acyl-carrier-protein] synthase III